MTPITLLAGAMAGGGRMSRRGDLTLVHLNSCSFATTAVDLLQAENWARARHSRGNPHRDRMAFVERFETVLARNGAGVATKGSRPILQGIVKTMKANGMQMEEWSIPINLDEGVEIRKKVLPAGRGDPAGSRPRP